MAAKSRVGAWLAGIENDQNAEVFPAADIAGLPTTIGVETSHPADRVDPGASSSYPTSQGRQEESSHESDSNHGSETATLSPRMKVKSRGDADSHSNALPSAIGPSLDAYHRPSDPSGVSNLKSQQPWYPEQSGDSHTRGRREQESPQSLAQQGSSGQGLWSMRTNANYVPGRGEESGTPSGLSNVISQARVIENHRASKVMPWLSRLKWHPAASDDSLESRSSNKTKETAPSALPAIESYRGERGGLLKVMPWPSRVEWQPTALGNSQSRSSNQQNETAPSALPAIESYGGEGGGGISQSRTGGQPISPSNSQARSTRSEKTRRSRVLILYRDPAIYSTVNSAWVETQSTVG